MPRSASSTPKSRAKGGSSGKRGAAGGSGRSKKRQRVETGPPLAPVRALRDKMRESKDEEKPSLQALGLERVHEVRDMDPPEVAEQLELLALRVASSVLARRGYAFSVPSRATGNQMFVEELNRIVLKDKRISRSFLASSSVRKTTILTRVMQLIHNVLLTGIHVTKRDLFYTDVKLFKEQNDSDAVLDDLACMVGCPRSCLNVVASEKGARRAGPLAAAVRARSRARPQAWWSAASRSARTAT